MCGFKSKWLLSDFEETVNQFDIFPSTETHLDEFDTVSWNNYSFVAKNRGQKVTKNPVVLECLLKALYMISVCFTILNANMFNGVDFQSLY